MKCRCYINGHALHDEQLPPFAELVPSAAMRRRMSRFLRMGVPTAMAALRRSGGDPAQVDAIITATGFGCLGDSEKFLRTMVEQREELLNPTPFIQSTFNTLGAQIALLCGNRAYNMTYAHRGYSFESALLDAAMLLDEGQAHHLLLGAADEQTPAQHRIMERMGLWRRHADGEGALFLLLSNEAGPRCAGCITEVLFPAGEELRASDDELMRRFEADRVVRPEPMQPDCATGAGRRLAEALPLLNSEVRRIVLCNNYMDMNPTVIVIEWAAQRS